MSHSAYAESQSINNWIAATDDHADHHLKLAEQVRLLLSNPTALPSDESRQLASKLERWRYQRFNECGHSRNRMDESILDQLDQWANQLRGTKPRSPRHARHAVKASSAANNTNTLLSEWFDRECDLESLTAMATQVTSEHFSIKSADLHSDLDLRRMLLYAPLYVSSHCVNHCRYCGFQFPLKIDRIHLNRDEVLQQSRILRERGFRHQLIVAGDFPRLTSTPYFCDLISMLRQENLELSIEIAAQSTDSYTAMREAGVSGVTLYQETYDESVYEQLHLKGPKASYHWRLEAPDRVAEAGIGRIGLGVLLGLADPVQDVRAMLRHAGYLKDRFPDLKLAFSLPRIRHAPEGYEIPFDIDDELLIRMYCICRLAFPDSELVLSTREPATLRDQLKRICITQMSAGSSTSPGGYSDTTDVGAEAEHSQGEQFPVVDQRPVETIAAGLRDDGFEVRWTFGQPGAALS
ncbi:radical SAM protein [Aporhodopirellula aestuarii]|uniref:Radical SAM protein n=1 Tax=Aporhodopirellula aestuarii TaxID=2950107 RepID=A0ABT0TWP7_9BACT|nr:radical SAM protein [Aporhodopirellula aestuarii]MCM2369048.1 radical SAM protein [Aporhodopirellula aestuarii]